MTSQRDRQILDRGASTFIENGFQRAIVQEYGFDGSSEYILELYDMGSPDNAQKVFTLRGGDLNSKPAAGQGGTLEDYYGLFWQGRYHFTITAYEPDGGTHIILTAIAAGVVDRIAGR